MNSNTSIRFKSLKIDDQDPILSSGLIEQKLYLSPFYWLLDSECEGLELEIRDKILTVLGGTIYWTDWKWGVWKGGNFLSGIWNGGVWFNGVFKGDWIRGLWKDGTFKGIDKSGKLFRVEQIK